MPQQDRTGPQGQGPGTEQKLGKCGKTKKTQGPGGRSCSGGKKGGGNTPGGGGCKGGGRGQGCGRS